MSDQSISRELAEQSLTGVKWFVWDTPDGDNIRPATEEEISTQTADDGFLVSDPYTVILHAGRVLVNAQHVVEYTTPPRENHSGFSIFQRGGFLGNEPQFVILQERQDVESLIYALQLALDEVFPEG